MKNTLCILGFCAFIILIQSCQDKIEATYKDYTDEEYQLLTQRLNIPEGTYDYSPNFDSNFFSNHPEEEIHIRRSNHKATLGRVLFYDKMLSVNEAVSCASCHKQELAFADDVAFSEGFDGEITTRNSLPLGNTIGFEESYGGRNSFQRAFFSWDESNHDIQSQSAAAINSEIEMGMNMSDVVYRVGGQEHYKILFEKAFGDRNIREHRVLDAIEEFVNSIVSSNSRFDKESMKEDGNIFDDFEGYSEKENTGKRLYMNNCSSCHSADHQFTEIATANNGLDMIYADKGVGEHTSDSNMNGVFKIPFLRNIELTGPYMHDGRFATLDDVINHYSEGIQNHDNLHFNLKSGDQAKNMNFSVSEKQALKSYLLTLTDKEMTADVKFTDPFK